MPGAAGGWKHKLAFSCAICTRAQDLNSFVSERNRVRAPAFRQRDGPNVIVDISPPHGQHIATSCAREQTQVDEIDQIPVRLLFHRSEQRGQLITVQESFAGWASE